MFESMIFALYLSTGFTTLYAMTIYIPHVIRTIHHEDTPVFANPANRLRFFIMAMMITMVFPMIRVISPSPYSFEIISTMHALIQYIASLLLLGLILANNSKKLVKTVSISLLTTIILGIIYFFS